ncbi:unnamed protein product [Ceratitis capitata]|uniref:(Mediterranean fruit fly) hypothetical protein n=1 Tax=Ceratitis capitata TaxID=7213 RepID=A0A811VAS9_CERCA|nr:unnamed protein product [Ceratitis capitata]
MLTADVYQETLELRLQCNKKIAAQSKERGAGSSAGGRQIVCASVLRSGHVGTLRLSAVAVAHVPNGELYY